MRELIAKLRDHVWTQGARDNFFGALMASAVLGLIGAILLWSKSGFSDNASTAWKAAKVAILNGCAWLFYPVEVPQGIVLLVGLVVAAYCIYWIVRKIRADIENTRKAKEDLLASVRSLGDAYKEALASKNEPTTPESEPLSELAENAMRALARVYPIALPLMQLCEIQFLSYAAVEQMVEGLEQIGYVTIEGGSGSRRARAVKMTKAGRDYSLKRGMDLV
jgi:hypothetical protein